MVLGTEFMLHKYGSNDGYLQMCMCSEGDAAVNKTDSVQLAISSTKPSFLVWNQRLEGEMPPSSSNVMFSAI